jgi:hypothetical protein
MMGKIFDIMLIPQAINYQVITHYFLYLFLKPFIQVICY